MFYNGLKNNFFNNYKLICLVILNIVFIFVMLSPMLRSGYISDDSLNSLTRGYLLINHENILVFTYSIMKGWILAGRFYPLSFYVYSLFTIINNLFIYKLSIMIFVIIDICLFGYFIKLVTKSTYIALISMLYPPFLFQFRLPNDPILSFHWLLELLFLYIIISLILLILFLRSHNKYFLIFSVFAYILSLLTYEITILFCAFHIIIISFETNHDYKNRVLYIVKISLPYILSSIFLILLTVCLRFYQGVPWKGGEGAFDYGYVPSFKIIAFVIALAKQTLAAFPFSYYYFDPLKIFPNIISYINNYFTFKILLIMALYSFLIWKVSLLAFSELRKLNNKINIKYLLLLGLSMLVLPEVLTSLSPKYQNEITRGSGYLPVYISYFGFTIIAITIIYLIYNKYKSNYRISYIISIALALVLGFASTINYLNNNIIVNYANTIWLYPRTIIEESLNNGLAENVPNNSLLIVDDNHPWDIVEFYAIYAKDKFRNIYFKGNYPITNFANDAFVGNYYNNYVYSFKNYNNVFYLRYDAFNKDSGYAIMGKINDLSFSKEKLNSATGNTIYIYYKFPVNKLALSTINISGMWNDKNDLNDNTKYDIFTLNEEQVRTLSYGKGWRIIDVYSKNKVIDLKSISVNGL